MMHYRLALFSGTTVTAISSSAFPSHTDAEDDVVKFGREVSSSATPLQHDTEKDNEVVKAVELFTDQNNLGIMDLQNGRSCGENNAYSLQSRQLGQGANATVYAVEYRKPDGNMLTVAAKQFEHEDWFVEDEVAILESLKHINVVTFFKYQVFPAEKMEYIFHEYANGGDLKKFREKLEDHCHDGRYENLIVKNIIKQIFEGLKYIHAQGISHNDINQGNVFISYSYSSADAGSILDSDLVVKIGDFGAAKDQSELGFDIASAQHLDIRAVGRIMLQLLFPKLDIPVIEHVESLRDYITKSEHHLDIVPVGRLMLQLLFTKLDIPVIKDVESLRDCIDKISANKVPHLKSERESAGFNESNRTISKDAIDFLFMVVTSATTAEKALEHDWFQ